MDPATRQQTAPPVSGATAPGPGYTNHRETWRAGSGAFLSSATERFISQPLHTEQGENLLALLSQLPFIQPARGSQHERRGP